MSQRVTPLTRNQLLELEALMRGLITVVTQQQQQQQQHHHLHTSNTSVSAGDQSWPSSASSTPASLTATAAVSAFAGPASSTSMAAAGCVDGPPAHATAVSHAFCVDHAVLRGTFMDVFTDPLTATAWRLYDKMLYVVWWSFRPPSCANCGMQDAWVPSGDVEFKCAFCLAGAGTTRSNAVVKDEAAANEEAEYGSDSGEEDEMEEKEKGNGGDGGGGGGSGGPGGGPIDTYLFFYEWLQRIPVLGPAGAYSTHNGVDSGAHDAGSPQRPSATGRMNAAPSSSSLSVGANYTGGGGGRSAPVAPGSAVPLASGGSSNSSSVLLPSGEALPAVLRAAYDMSCLLTAPGLPRGTAPVVRAAGLYLSLLLHRYVSLFPLFCVAGRASSTEAKENAATSAPPSPRADGQLAEVELQWIDVELVCALLGVSAPSFFESTAVSVQHLQNVFTVAAGYGVPSVLWHPGRAPGRVEVMKTLKDKVIPLCPLHSTTAGVSGLCPEHTAMIVALEFARRVDAHPVAASSTSPAAASQNAQRIGMWLDALGLYPTRRVYRDVGSFHHARRSGDDGGDASRGVTKEESADEEEEKGRSNDTMRAWEKTLTELAAVNDAHLTAAADRHARRHDALAATLDSTVNSNSSTGSASTSYLTTPSSPFHKHFEWILTSPCANALLHVFAAVFCLTPMELADMALRSGIYQGHASGFVATLRSAVQRGAFDVMPLARRLSPVAAGWVSAYMALHSSDRLPLLAALVQLNDGQNSTRDRQAALVRLLQKILRKHHAAQLYQLNYVLRVTDEDEKHFNGVYFLSNVLWQQGLAVFTCLRSGRKSITLNRFAHTLSLCYMNTKEKIVSRLNMHVVSPVVAAVETEAARLVLEVALGTVARGVSTHGDPWGTVVRCLDKCARVRRRMRVPMLASRLDALASIRETVSSAAGRRFQQPPSSLRGGGGSMAMGPTLLGWGETETLLASAPQLDVRQLRRDLQWNFLALPNVSLLSGLSENRVVAMYASLVGILELIHNRLSTSTTAAAALLSNWVEELLFVEEDEDEDEMPAAHDLVDGFGGTFPMGGGRSGPGWSPPMYRNSRGETPKLSRSPKSKFIAVSTSTNTTSGSAATSVFATTHYATHNRSRSTLTTTTTFAREPYTMTPPSMAPSRSPVLRTVTTTASATMTSTPPLSTVRAPQGGSKGSYNTSVSAFASSSHIAVSTPISRVHAPPLGMGGGPSLTPPLQPCTSGEVNRTSSGVHTNRNSSGSADLWHGEGVDVVQAGQLPDLELSASTADVERRLSSGSKRAPPLQRPQHRAGRRRQRERADDGRDEGSRNETAEEDGSDQDEGKDSKVNQQQQQLQEQQEQVLRLLRQMLPPYWEVLLGLTTDLALPNATAGSPPSATNTRAGVRGELVDEEDDGESEGRQGGVGDDARRMATHARERRLRRQQQQHHHYPQNSGSSGSGGDRTTRAVAAATARSGEKESNAATTSRAAAAMAAGLRSEVGVAHRPFNLFDAEECRRRLHRLYTFIGAYIQCKLQCQERAAAGTLPSFPEGKNVTSPPQTRVIGASSKPSAAAATTGSPIPSIRGAAGEKAAAGVKGDTNSINGNGRRLRSPHVHLTPPPLFNPPAGPQRSPPQYRRSSPPFALQQPQQQQQPSPPHSPEPRNSTVSAAPRPSRQSGGGGGTSPVPLSPSPAAAPRKSGADGGSPKHQQHRPPATPPTQRSPPLQSKRMRGTDKSGGGGRESHSKVGREETAAVVVALVDDDNFSLPPSEVTWANSSNEQQQPSRRATRDGERGRKETTERRRLRQQQQQLRAASSSATSSDTESEGEKESLRSAVSPPPPQTSSPRKRVRGGSESGADATASDDVDDDGNAGLDGPKREQIVDHSGADGDADDDAPPPPPLQQPQTLRRKAKKLGRRRRRQEQSYQHPPPQQQQSPTHAHLVPRSSSSSSSSTNTSSKEPSRSPDIRAWRNGKISGSVSPLDTSPALPPRPSNADSVVKQKPRTSNPATPAQNTVPSIRGRSTRASEETATSSASDSGRSAGYDTDTN
ncbi:hypothetical protein ABB37_07154 [Leptomonas pyrrhocoris]|uniref:Uncharacterized protein n=1 Tax=Leptomonas pyrrhocoris TaxID=157538 RepID=A0A0M9FWA2_LEPPY|nr:hypothetical protein ABB37_07154 [Leptomonas pyrrhocoris]KPA77257.1 hypothetical protein ABB37_07154 [Leptomonas pyrrhocoris]|eukprot:XP_015655696.1 hypothetical protein ABB37_07154 [Leptomonas pyrrhocoris]